MGVRPQFRSKAGTEEVLLPTSAKLSLPPQDLTLEGLTNINPFTEELLGLTVKWCWASWQQLTIKTAFEEHMPRCSRLIQFNPTHPPFVDMLNTTYRRPAPLLFCPRIRRSLDRIIGAAAQITLVTLSTILTVVSMARGAATPPIMKRSKSGEDAGTKETPRRDHLPIFKLHRRWRT